MKKGLVIIIAALFVSLTANGQDLFLIGEKSYPCTKAITLKSNSDERYDLDIFLAKNGKSGLFAVSRESILGEVFTGKLIIYLKDGNVLTCNESVASEKVDDRSKALYNLTADQLNKLKTSNIHTVKYTMIFLSKENNFSASNKELETKDLITEFFKE